MVSDIMSEQKFELYHGLDWPMSIDELVEYCNRHKMTIISVTLSTTRNGGYYLIYRMYH